MAKVAELTLFDHAVSRAIRVWGGENADPSSLMSQLKVLPKCARLSAFIVTWAVARDELQVEGKLSPEVYADMGYDSTRTTYRRLHEYGEFFPDVPIDELAQRLQEASARRGEKLDPGRFRLRLPVAA